MRDRIAVRNIRRDEEEGDYDSVPSYSEGKFKPIHVDITPEIISRTRNVLREFLATQADPLDLQKSFTSPTSTTHRQSLDITVPRPLYDGSSLIRLNSGEKSMDDNSLGKKRKLEL